jgi:hypothetical protein
MAQVPLKMHWIITLQAAVGTTGFVTSTFTGWRDVLPGEKRGAVFAEIFEARAAAMSRPPGAAGLPNVMFFALEPDEIERGT